jgi:LysM repeat protein
MTREQQPRRTGRRAAEALTGVGVAAGLFWLGSEVAGADQGARTQVSVDQLNPNQQSVLDACQITPANLYLARGYTAADEVGKGSEDAAKQDALFAVTTPKKDQGIMAFARECLGITKDTPDPTGTIRATLGALTKQIGADSQLENPNNITDETPLTVNMTLIADMRRHIGTAQEAQNPKLETPQSSNPKPSEPTISQSETTKTPDTPAITYKVARGDWLGKIAKDHGTTVEAIKAANPDIDPNLILVNQVLNIPLATAPENTQVNAPPAVEQHLDQPEDQPAFLTTDEQLREVLDEVAANSTDITEKTALTQAQIIRRDDALTPEQLNDIAAQMGDDSIQLLITPATTSQEAGVVVTLDSGAQATTLQANVGETCFSDAKWVIGCTVVINTPPTIHLILREQGKKGGPNPLMRQIVGTYDLYKQRQEERAAKALSQIQKDAERLGGTGAGYALYSGVPVLIDAQGDLVTDADGRFVRITTPYQKPMRVAPSPEDADLIAHIQKGDRIHLVQSTDLGIDAIAREHIHALLKNKNVVASDEDIAALTALWADAIIGANGNDIITPNQALYLPNPETLSNFSTKLAGLAAQKKRRLKHSFEPKYE